MTFNSAMVRLRPGFIRDVGLTGAGFQFRYGAIETYTYRAPEGPERLFQFRYGAIETVRHICLPAELTELSIPLWCD